MIKIINGVKHVYNPIAWDTDSKVHLNEDGTISYDKQGAWVKAVKNRGRWI